MKKDTPRERMLAAEALYQEMRKDNAALRQFEESLDAMAERAEDMRSYYQTQWLEDRDALEDAEDEVRNLEAMGEDPIFIEITEQYETLKRILLKCAAYINR